MRFSRQTPLASTGARALKRHGTGCFMDSYTATAVCLRLRYLCICIWSAAAQKLYNSLVSGLIKRPVNSTITFSPLLFESAQQIRRLFQSLIL